MVITEELLVSITQTLTRKYGSDIAHDVAVVILRRRNPLSEPLHWAHRYAAGLAKREILYLAKIKVFSDVPATRQVMLDLPNGSFIEQPTGLGVIYGKNRTGRPTGRPWRLGLSQSQSRQRHERRRREQRRNKAKITPRFLSLSY